MATSWCGSNHAKAFGAVAVSVFGRERCHQLTCEEGLEAMSGMPHMPMTLVGFVRAFESHQTESGRTRVAS